VTDDPTPIDPPDGALRLVVVHGGEPTEEEVAALVVALAATTTPADEQPRTPSGWTNRRSMLRRPLDHGPGRWAASARPTS